MAVRTYLYLLRASWRLHTETTKVFGIMRMHVSIK